jgi:hypothetical protein
MITNIIVTLLVAYVVLLFGFWALSRLILHWQAVQLALAALVALLILSGVVWATSQNALGVGLFVVTVAAFVGAGYAIADGIPWLWRRWRDRKRKHPPIP